jgi:hypothetical protein
MVAPIIPAINDAEIEAILARAQAMGARAADYVLLRLPLEVREHFAEWPRAHYPGKLKHVGGDITRPQNQLDIRLQYRTSWQPATRTQQERMLLRVTSKLKLDAGWTAGLLGEAPFVDKRTTTFDSNNSGNASRSENKFGVGDAAFQTYLAHDLDQNWAFGFGARGVGPSAQDSLGSGVANHAGLRGTLFLRRCWAGHLFCSSD